MSTKKDLPNLFNFGIFFHVGISILICTFLAESVSSIDPKYESCRPKNCGSGPDISFPFWIYGTGKEYCGYPGFAVGCEDHKPIFRTSQSHYIIQNISYTNQSFLLVNEVIDDATSCLTPLQNFSFDLSSSFRFQPIHADLLFFYNCTNLVSVNCTKTKVACASNYTHQSFVALDTGEENFSCTSLSCESLVAAPVELGERQINKTIDTLDYVKLLKNGFTLEWFGISCAECQTSGGFCGFDNESSVCFCPDRPHPKHCKDGSKKSGLKLALVIAGASAAGMGVLMFIIYFLVRIKFSSNKSPVLWNKETQNHRNFVAFLKDYGSLAPKRYSYSDVKKMTYSFKHKLGQGGYGGVYKGKLQNGRLVAVKVLNNSKGDGQEFFNEVASIIRTSHVNIVTLLGFCFEGSKRALLYEFMPNGSLEKFIYDENQLGTDRQLGWETLYQIAIGIARGLEYLHCGCNTQILHFDIKPHNILLYENLCPKISDFGLAKLCPGKQSIISMLDARGTAGYIAPEVFCRSFGGVSHKSDVYSYGMMVLEMVGGRKNIDVGVDHTSQIYFPHWIHKRLEHGGELGLHGIMNEEENDKARKMILVGLWCIQTNPSNRPPINRVLDMLQGSFGSLQIPPCPFLSSPPRSPVDSSTTPIVAS